MHSLVCRNTDLSPVCTEKSLIRLRAPAAAASLALANVDCLLCLSGTLSVFAFTPSLGVLAAECCPVWLPGGRRRQYSGSDLRGVIAYTLCLTNVVIGWVAARGALTSCRKSGDRGCSGSTGQAAERHFQASRRCAPQPLRRLRRPQTLPPPSRRKRAPHGNIFF